jgi:hypothetical protein
MFLMDAAIEFDRKFGSVAEEIDDIPPRSPADDENEIRRLHFVEELSRDFAPSRSFPDAIA